MWNSLVWGFILKTGLNKGKKLFPRISAHFGDLASKRRFEGVWRPNLFVLVLTAYLVSPTGFTFPKPRILRHTVSSTFKVPPARPIPALCSMVLSFQTQLKHHSLHTDFFRTKGCPLVLPWGPSVLCSYSLEHSHFLYFHFKLTSLFPQLLYRPPYCHVQVLFILALWGLFITWHILNAQ